MRDGSNPSQLNKQRLSTIITNKAHTAITFIITKYRYWTVY